MWTDKRFDGVTSSVTVVTSSATSLANRFNTDRYGNSRIKSQVSV